MKKPAKLRICGLCDWIFDKGLICPRCFFASYAAHCVHGSKVYRFKITQKPWVEKQMKEFERFLHSEVTREEYERFFNSEIKRKALS